ncbi:MAG: hypothetical protein ABSB42_12025 [Tepidisphaeraceae bacterium]|jgi:t-SNARE complex subunit (syntaxin)
MPEEPLKTERGQADFKRGIARIMVFIIVVIVLCVVVTVILVEIYKNTGTGIAPQ